jgi:hypothetical protein
MVSCAGQAGKADPAIDCSIADLPAFWGVRFGIGRLGTNDQMTVLGKDALCLQAPRVMQRREQSLKQAGSRRRFRGSDGRGSDWRRRDGRRSDRYGGIDRRWK